MTASGQKRKFQSVSASPLTADDLRASVGMSQKGKWLLPVGHW